LQLNKNTELEDSHLVKFSIVHISGNPKDMAYLIKELRANNLIAGVEKDVGGDTVYSTHNLAGVKRVMAAYEGLMLDILKD
jgi:hypothetical protein